MHEAGAWDGSMEHACITEKVSGMSQVATCRQRRRLLLARIILRPLLPEPTTVFAVYLGVIVCATVTVLGISFGMAYDSYDAYHDDKRDHGMAPIQLPIGSCC